MRRTSRFVAGVAVGGGAFAGYLAFVGVGSVTPWAFVAVRLLVVAEALADSIGVWASVRPLAGGVSPVEGAQLALAGDFFDTLSPAGPVSSEPIVARFVGVETGTTYGAALAVRAVAKYVKSGAQLLVATLVGLVVPFDGAAARALTLTLAGTGVGVALLPVLAVVPLPRMASVVPEPGSLGASDVLLGEALVLATGAPEAVAAAAVVPFRTVSLPFGLASGGLAVEFLRGWRPS